MEFDIFINIIPTDIRITNSIILLLFVLISQTLGKHIIYFTGEESLIFLISKNLRHHCFFFLYDIFSM